MNNPTAQQTSILDAAKSSSTNLMLNALAGCGKTSTLEMIERVVDTKPILYLVFNKKNAEEAEERLLSTTTVRTFNSLGHRIWAKSVGKNLKLDSKKTQTILRSLINETPKAQQGPIWDSYWEIIQGVGLAKALGYVPDGAFLQAKRLISQSSFHASLDEAPDDLISDLIDAVLIRSIKASYEGTIDFNDQIYMPALFGGTYPRFPIVMVDEVQDLNPVNHEMLRKLAKHRVIAVGDPHQSIYGFRGALYGGMSELQKQFTMVEMDLSVSFRCPSEIVKHVQWRVPNFKWIREGGEVDRPEILSGGSIMDSSAIICRNNAPLFRLALHLLSHKRSVSVAGSDVGPKIVAMMRKLGPEEMNKNGVLHAIDSWLAERLAKSSASAQDLADCMKVFAGFGSSLGQAISYAEHLFAQKGTIRLLTGHKAKGLEWDTVYHLDPWLCGESEQDQNLRYVISTRSKNKLVEIDSSAIRW